MAVLKNPIVVKCKYCGHQMVLSKLRTMQPDEEGELLFKLAKDIANNAVCPWCKRRIDQEKEKGNGKKQ